MADIAEFLTARWGEEQAAAEAAVPEGGTGRWEVNGSTSCYIVDADDTDEITIYDEGGHSPRQAQHIALHDPARVLADLEAKRAILARVAEDAAIAWSPRAQAVPDCDWHLIAMARDVLKLLVQPYREHPDFDRAWSVGVETSG